MKEIHITLSTDFVMKNFSGGKVPTNLIKDALDDVDAISVVQKNPYELVVTVKDPASLEDSLDGIRSIVLNELAKQYSVSAEEVGRIVDYEISDREEKTESEKHEEPEEREEQEEKPAEEASEQEKESDVPRRTAEQKKTETESAKAAGSNAEAVMEKIRALKGSEEFRALAEELHRMAPVLKENKAESVLVQRSYLFSVDPGFGLTCSLNCLADLLREDGLMSVKGEAKEFLLEAPGGNKDVLAEAADQFRMTENRVVCFDISNWSDQVGTPEFRDFLTKLQKNGSKLVFVFRVPYLEQSVLNRISYALNDVMTVKTITFVPLETKQLCEITEKELAKYGFTASEDAMEQFVQRLADEKSDGRFYGIQTCIKIVSEMVYDKLRTLVENPDSASLSEEQRTTITAADLKADFTRKGRGEKTADELFSELIGVDKIRRRIEEIVTQIEYARSNKTVQAPAMHMRFVGNPGTGKTTVARVVGQLLKERGILAHGYFFEHAGSDFIGMYVGHTAPKTQAICRDAYGSVLFIDEAYTLADANYRDGQGFAKEAIDTLIAQMENHREDMVVIMAGYPKEMEELMNINPGLEGRMPYLIEFPNYDRDELRDIFFLMVKQNSFVLGEGVKEDVESYFAGLTDKMLNAKDFANARFVRNLFELTWSKTIMRAQMDGSDPHIMKKEDFEAACSESGERLNSKNRPGRVGYHVGLV